MRDLIPPALARRPVEACELVCLAISDGDLEAALAQYELSGMLRPWATGADGLAAAPFGDTPTGATAASGAVAADEGTAGPITAHALAPELSALMEFRLPLTLRVRAVVPGSGVALVLGDRHMRGRGPDGQQVQLSGSGATVVRRTASGSWRIAADAWCLAGPGEPAG